MEFISKINLIFTYMQMVLNIGILSAEIETIADVIKFSEND